MTQRPIVAGGSLELTVYAFAKVNLMLRVLARRPDGYHDLCTVFQSVALRDRLTFRVRPGPFRISSTDPDCPTDESNLVWRAADEVWRAAKRCGRPTGVNIAIAKGIPTQAGLGGGSSDAAAALRAFASLWCRRIEPSMLARIAARLGADVPYFLVGGTVLGLGRGDCLYPLPDRPTSWIVIARPAVGVSTKDAFDWLDQDDARRSRESARRDAPVSGTDGEGGNDLQRVVERRHPIVKRLTTALRREGADWAAMSGSGSAVFGVFAARARAERAAARLQTARCTTFVTRTLTGRDYGGRSALAIPRR